MVKCSLILKIFIIKIFLLHQNSEIVMRVKCYHFIFSHSFAGRASFFEPKFGLYAAVFNFLKIRNNMHMVVFESGFLWTYIEILCLHQSKVIVRIEICLFCNNYSIPVIQHRHSTKMLTKIANYRCPLAF